MMVHLLLPLPHDQVLEEVDSERVAGAEVDLRVLGEEDVYLPLGAKLGCKRRRSHVLLHLRFGLHGKILVNLIL